MIKKPLFLFFLLLAFIQFIRPAKNQSTLPSPGDIARHLPVPDSVAFLLKRSCYDCHSDNTVYPWYDNIQPVGWWLQYHVNHGKHSLNFSEFSTYTPERQAKKLTSISHLIRQDDMPLGSYLWIHKNAVLSPEEKDLLVHWADGAAAGIKKGASTASRTE